MAPRNTGNTAEELVLSTCTALPYVLSCCMCTIHRHSFIHMCVLSTRRSPARTMPFLQSSMNRETQALRPQHPSTETILLRCLLRRYGVKTVRRQYDAMMMCHHTAGCRRVEIFFRVFLFRFFLKLRRFIK